jgi:hypothetical protein
LYELTFPHFFFMPLPFSVDPILQAGSLPANAVLLYPNADHGSSAYTPQPSPVDQPTMPVDNPGELYGTGRIGNRNGCTRRLFRASFRFAFRLVQR